MVSRKCDQCGATVAGDEQFCPNCGSYIDPLTDAPAPRGDNVISVNSDGNYEEFELGAPPPSAERQGSSRKTANGPAVECPSCGATNPSNNRHCQECGARLSQGPLPTAPRPAVQATAGVRAALAISALLFAVVVIALLFNIFNGDDETPESTVSANSTTTTVLAELAPIDILDATCSRDGIGAFVCDNLISGTDAEYQFNYEEVPEGETITIRLTFNQPMAVSRIDWVNLLDPIQFRRNYRARGIVINAQDSLQATPLQLEDLPGSQLIPYAAIDTNWIEITIESDFPAEVVEDNVFTEMAIQEIQVIGRPSTTTSTIGSATTLPGAATTVPGGATTTTP